MYYCTLCIKNNDNDHFNVKYEGISNLDNNENEHQLELQDEKLINCSKQS